MKAAWILRPSRTLGALLVLALPLGSARAAPNPEVSRARGLYESGDFKAARDALVPLVKKLPGDGVLRHQLGVCLEMLGEKEKGKQERLKALPLLERAVSAPVPPLPVLYYLVGDYQLAGAQDKVKAALERVAKLWQEKKLAASSPSETYQLAALLDRADKKQDATALFEEAVKDLRAGESPNRRYLSDAYVRLGNAAMDAKDTDKAQKLFEDAVSADPKNAAAFYARGVVRDGQKRPEEARKDYEKAIELDPSHFYARFNLANLLAIQGKGEEALSAFQKALDTNPAGEDLARTYEVMGKLSELLGKHRDASDFYAKLGKVKPSPGAELASRYALAHALEQEGKMDDALKLLRELSGRAPDLPQLRAEIAGILLSRKDYDAAEKELLSAITLQPGEGTLYLALGRAYAEHGKKADAEAAFKKALAIPATKGAAQKELDGLKAAGAKGKAGVP